MKVEEQLKALRVQTLAVVGWFAFVVPYWCYSGMRDKEGTVFVSLLMLLIVGGTHMLSFFVKTQRSDS